MQIELMAFREQAFQRGLGNSHSPKETDWSEKLMQL